MIEMAGCGNELIVMERFDNGFRWEAKEKHLVGTVIMDFTGTGELLSESSYSSSHTSRLPPLSIMHDIPGLASTHLFINLISVW